MAAIIFDLDGTLVDSLRDIHAAVNFLLRHEGREEIDLKTPQSFVGNGLPKLTERVMAARGFHPSEFERCRAILSDYYVQHASDLTCPYPSVEASLQRLKALGFSLGICTNKPEAPARSILGDLDLSQYFDVIVGGDTLAVKKPDPKPLQAAMTQMNASSCLYVGDSEVDAQTAVNAMVDFALFTEGYRKTPVAEIPHTYQFSDFGELTKIVELWAS